MEEINKLIELKGISVSFDGEKVLDELDLSIADGE
ncbi:MAG: ABC transporter ATP-binding protein, partial [Ruminococcaceae bacterium]|nr:ABC transporter ATP-binding protein [Oscillospiraceae bacterium]